MNAWPRLHAPADPRWYQIGSLGALNLYGLSALDFEARPATALALLATALATQWLGGRWAGLPRYDPKSATISALGLCFLLRTESLGLAALAAALAIGSKFLIRTRGKHLFNPTNFALVALLATTDRVWVSPGQWGSEAFLAFLAACCGFLVVHRTARSDVTLAFLAAWAALLVGRSLWLGEPMAIPLHRLENGTLLIFAFFMISDPKTVPDSRAGRLLFAALVALGAFTVQFVLFRTNGLLWSLAACSTAVPLIDRLLPGARYEWAGRTAGPAGLPYPIAPGVAIVRAAEEASTMGGAAPGELALRASAPAIRTLPLSGAFRRRANQRGASLGAPAPASVVGTPERADRPVAPAPGRAAVSPFNAASRLRSNRRGAQRAAPPPLELANERRLS